MNSGWTRGQYSIFRVVLGLYLLQHFLALLPWGKELFSSAGVLPRASLSPLTHLFPNILALADSPAFVAACLVTAAVLSVFFIIGKFDRAAGLLIWYLWACFYGRNPLIGNPSMPFIGWLLLAHLLIPSVSPREPVESMTGWRMPKDIYLAAWILMSLAYTYSGYTKLVSPSWVDGSALSRVLANPLARDTIIRVFLLSLPAWVLKAATWSGLALELSFAPLALLRRVRPWLWLAMVGMHLGLMLLVNFTDLTAGMLILHLFTFDPAWLPGPRPAGQPIFFDGHCGLCHGFVQFALQEDQSPEPFSFAPLQGDFVRRTVPDDVRAGLPDSVAVLDAKNRILTRSAAVIFVMKRLGGLWVPAAFLLSLVPRPLRDFGYDAIASVRKKIFGTTENLCPLVPVPWRGRFKD
jgi:predicted DCC family thiol-disulfide oxidoreductase YuxK